MRYFVYKSKRDPSTWLRRIGIVISLSLSVIGSIGCRTASPPFLNVPGDGAHVFDGQAIWTSNTGATSIAGELLVISASDESFFVQFSKPPFNLVTAQSSQGRWTLQWHQRRKQQGLGQPPPNIVWFQLARALTGRPPHSDWRFSSDIQNGLVLSNPVSGETLKGYFSR